MFRHPRPRPQDPTQPAQRHPDPFTPQSPRLPPLKYLPYRLEIERLYIGNHGFFVNSINPGPAAHRKTSRFPFEPALKLHI